MGEHVVSLKRTEWNFFERQRVVFKSTFTDTDFSEFDKELERMRTDMLQLKPPDMKDLGSSLLKVDHPIVQDSQGNKRLSLRFDCKDYKPDEIVVKTVDNSLMVQAKHTEESAGRKVSRQFSRQYILPEKIDPMTLNSTLSADGVLSIEGPAPAACEAFSERILPITQL
ncbi:hypothetical protein ACOMHN_016116 [Nucella lapillus]